MPPETTRAAGTAEILSSIRVLDLSRVISGPCCTQALADMGATVFKIEKPGDGDDMRHFGAALKDRGGRPTRDTTGYVANNRGKQSITIDFTRPEGARIVRELARRCDVVVENYKAGALKRYGLDYPSLRALNREIVYCSITGFGPDGPYAGRPAYDFIMQGMSGLMSVCGRPDGEPGAGPMRTSVAITDVIAGLYATIGILGALWHRARTGQGQLVDGTMLDASVSVLGHLAVGYLMTGRAPARAGNSNPIAAPSEVFATRDGHVILAVGNDGQFQGLCRALGRPDVGADPRFATNPLRVENRRALVAELEVHLAARTSAEWLTALEAAGVPCGPIHDLAGVFDDPQVRHRELVVEVDHPALGPLRLVRSPLNFSATPVQHRSPPTLGQHTDEVLRNVLGLDDAAIARLRAAGVLDPPDRAGAPAGTTGTSDPSRSEDA